MSASSIQRDPGDTLSLRVQGPAGIIDLVVPAGVNSHDVAREYAGQTGLAAIPLLRTVLGEPIPAGRSLADSGVESGDLVVAAVGVHWPREMHGMPQDAQRHSPRLAYGVGACASVLAVTAGLLAADATRVQQLVVAVVLAVAAFWSCLGLGGRNASWAQVLPNVAPAFAMGAMLAVLGHTGSWLPLSVVAAASGAALAAAALARACTPGPDESLRVWMVSAGLVAALCAAPVLLAWPEQIAWTLMLVTCALAARFVPTVAIDVPDLALLEIDRLAVTAWSARDQAPTSRRGRLVVSTSAMSDLVASGSRIVTAAAVAVLSVVVAAAPALLGSVRLGPDRLGAGALLFCWGAVVLLAARSYRHRAARLMLQISGVWAWLWCAIAVLAWADLTWQITMLVGCMVAGAALIAAAVAAGRGWRSVWWARRAEVAEVVAGSLVLAMAVLSSGVFRLLTEIRG